MNCWFDCIQIRYGCSLGIFDNLINFWDESIKNKKVAAAIYKKRAVRNSVLNKNLTDAFCLFLQI